MVLAAAMAGQTAASASPVVASASTSAGTSSAPVTPRAKVYSTTQLAINLVNVPKGATPNVKITGPENYSKTISSSTTLSSLVPGNYTVSAVTVNATGGTAKPSPSTKTVAVKEKKLSTTTITYSFVATPIVAPGAPTNLRLVEAGNRKVSLAWTAPKNTGGSPIVDYVIDYKDVDVNKWVNFKDGKAETARVTVTGLVDGKSYMFRVAAVNSKFTGDPTYTAKPITPQPTVSDPPTNVVGTSGNGWISVKWDAPEDNGDSKITGYTVTSKPESKTCTTAANDRNCTVKDLTNGKSYTFTVKATNGVGNSAPSAPSDPVAPATVPGAPRNITVAAFDTKVRVSWTAPVDNGGAAVTGYTVTSDPEGKKCETTGALTCDVMDLTNGTGYTFTVKATNSAGKSAASAQSVLAIPQPVPSPPSGVTATRGQSREVVITWLASSSSNSSPVTRYTVTSSPENKTCTWRTGDGLLRCTIAGLTNGTPYTFSVTATNASGTSPATVSESVTPATLPGTPTIHPDAEPHDTFATVYWDAPSDDGGDAIYQYVVTAMPGEQTCVALATERSCSVIDLTNDTTYSFTVRAVNTVGSSPATTTLVEATPQPTPLAPTNVVAIPHDGSAAISWDAADVLTGPAITAYLVTSASEDDTTPHSCPPTTELTCIVTGLENGDAYTFTVIARSIIGDSAPSDPSESIVPAAAPSAPAITSAIPGNGKVTVTWSRPVSNGGAHITSYTVTSTPDSKTCEILTIDGDFTYCDVTELSNGTPYSFVVTATNAAGSTDSEPSDSVTPATVPDAPTNVAGEPHNESALVSWTPGYDGGAVITHFYVVSSSLDDPVPHTCDTDGLQRSCSVQDLINGTAYTFTVYAHNIMGDSETSDPSDTVMPLPLPLAPTNLVGVRGNARATLTWDAADLNGGLPIDEYIVTSQPDAHTCIAQAPDLTCDVTGLTNGDNYTFTVRARSAIGDSGESSVSNSVTPATVPSQPAIDNDHSVFGNAQATVWWRPGFNGGSPVTRYVVTSSSLVDAEPHTCEWGGEELHCDVTGLINGVEYTFTVVATNSVGDSDVSAPSEPLTPSTKPSAPQVTGELSTATRGNASATVTWTEPLSNGGSVITGYTVTSHSLADGSDHTCRWTSGPLTCTVPNLTNGVVYTFTVTATNKAGESEPSDVFGTVIPATVPNAPSISRVEADHAATRGNASATVRWSAPFYNGGDAVIGYTVTSSSATDLTPHTCTWEAGDLTCTVTGLTNGVDYTFTVIATNTVGSSVPSNVSLTVTPSAPPAPPTSVTGVSGGGEVTVSWLAPTNNGGAPVQRYVVSSTPTSAGCEVYAPELSCTVTGLINATDYTFTVVAVNVAGISDPSEASAIVVPAVAPDAPVISSVTTNDASIDVSWNAPLHNNGSAVVTYLVRYIDAGVDQQWSAWVDTQSTSTSYRVTGLINGHNYRFQVMARNGAADPDSDPSTQSVLVKPATNPGVPGNVVASPEGQRIYLTWSEPSNGGLAIIDYLVQYKESSSQTWIDYLDGVSIRRNVKIEGLTNGISYDVRVRAKNTAIQPLGPWTDAYSAVPLSVPPATPTNLVAVPGDASVALTWDEPSDGGSPITDYDVSYSEDARSWTPFDHAPFTTPSVNVTGLTNGTAYVFRVRAKSLIGVRDEYSLPSSSVTPWTNPEPPIVVDAQRGEGQVTLNWREPVNNGGGHIVAYIIRYSTDGENWTDFETGITADVEGIHSVIMDGLTNGAAYSFKVLAKSSNDLEFKLSDPASWPGTYTPSSAPDAITSLTAERQSRSVQLSWPAANDGGTPITNYVVQYKTLLGNWITLVRDDSTVTSVLVENLVNGTTYSFRVQAVNPQGGSTWYPSDSDAPVTATPATIPNVVASAVAVKGNTQAIVNWTIPSSDGGTAITGYEVQEKRDTYQYWESGTDWTTLTDADPTDNTVTSTGLRNFRTYHYRVRAINGVGPSDWVETNAVIPNPYTVADAPTDVVADDEDALDRSVVIHWVAPSRNGGTAITDYAIQYSRDNGQSWSNYVHDVFNPVVTTTTVTGLRNDVTYVFRVAAVNADGTGPYSLKSGPATPLAPSSLRPPIVSAPTAVAADGTATLTWSTPSVSPGMEPITYYMISASANGADFTVVVPDTGSTATTKVVTGLTNGIAYRFRIQSHSGAGNSKNGGASNYVVPNTAATRCADVVAYANMRNAYLANCDLSSRNLTGVNFNGANLTGARLNSATIHSATFVGAKMAYSNLSNANGWNGSVDFSGADLTGANMTGIQLNGATFTAQTSLSGSDFSSANVNYSTFNGANLDRVTMASTNLSYVSMRGASLKSANLTSGTLTGADFTGASLRSANLSYGNDATAVIFSGADLTGAKLMSRNFSSSVISDTTVLTGVNFTSSNLSSWDLSGRNMDGANFSSAYLDWSDLSGASLIGANFEGAHVTYANLRGANLTGASIRNARMEQSNLSGVIATGADFTNTYLEYSVLAGADLTRATLSSVPMNYVVMSSSTILTGANLRSATMNYASLIGVNFASANVSSAYIQNATLTGANFADATMQGTRLGGSSLRGVTFNAKTDLSGANLDNVNLDGLDMSGIAMNGASASGSSFVGTNLTGAFLRTTNFSNSDFTNANLTRTNFSTDYYWQNSMTNVIMSGANLTGANFRSDNLSDATFSATTILNNTDFAGTQMSRTVWHGTAMVGGLFDGTDLTGATFVDVDFTDAQLINSNATNASFTSTSTFTRANFTNSTFTGATFGAANLTGVNLRSANLTGASLRGANLSGTDLRSATVTSADMANSTLSSTTLLDSANLTGVNLRGATIGAVTFSGTSMSYADLTGVDLRQASLMGGNLTYAYLAGADLRGMRLTSMDFTGARMMAANLAGANMYAATLSGANLTSANLTGTNLTSSNITGAILVGADLTTADFGNAQMSRVIMDATTTVSYTAFVSTNLSYATLSGVTLDHVNMTDATLTGAKLVGTTFDSTGTFLRTSFSSVIFTGANITGGNFTSATFTGAVLDGFNLSPLTLTSASFSLASLVGADLRSSAMVGASFNAANLTNANLSGVDDHGGDFTYARLAGANLSNSNFTSANFSISKMDGTNMTGTTFTSATFSNAIMANSNVSGATFTSATFTSIQSSGLTGTPTASPSGWSLVGGSWRVV